MLGQLVMLASFDQAGPSLPVEERVALALERCGVSITCELRCVALLVRVGLHSRACRSSLNLVFFGALLEVL